MSDENNIANETQEEPKASAETRGENIGILVGVLSLVFCSMEMVPGWGIFKLDWPPETFYTIGGVCGAIGGFLYAHENRLGGLLGGCVGELGALFAVQLLLHNVNRVPQIALIIVGLLGALPGYGLYWILTKVKESVTGPKETTLNLD